MSYNSALTNKQLREFPLEITEEDKLIIAELRVISTLLQIGLGVKDEIDDIRNDILNTLQ